MYKSPAMHQEYLELRARIGGSGLFDAKFYRQARPEILSDADALDHFIQVGVEAGYQPSAKFHPSLYLDWNPDVAESGQPAILHFLEHGKAEGRKLPDPQEELRDLIRGSGLFDPEFYRNLHTEIGPDVDPLDYYIKFGLAAEHRPSIKFEPELYFAQNPDVAQSGQSAFLHYLRHGRFEGRKQPSEEAELYTLISVSTLFDGNFYSEYYTDVKQTGLDPVVHYIRVGRFEYRRPSLEFDSLTYLTNNKDIEESGIDPFIHYLRYGNAEGRLVPPISTDWLKVAKLRKLIEESGLFDPKYYLSENYDVEAKFKDPVLHYILEGFKDYKEVSPKFSLTAYAIERGLSLNRELNPLQYFLESDANISSLIESRINAYDPAPCHPAYLPEVEFSRMENAAFLSRFAFKPDSEKYLISIARVIKKLVLKVPKIRIGNKDPDVSIVIPIYGQMPYVLNCLDGLSEHVSRFTVEIVIADDASPSADATELLPSIPWIRYIRRPQNVGFLENCNGAVELCRGKYILLLNNDTRPVDRWLDELAGTFELSPKAGYVGSQLINGDGTLQEAGGVYWSNGAATNYGRGESYLNPRYNFARQVDWVSGASIAIRSDLWRQLGGFDLQYRPAYCEDLDLAFEVRNLGFEVWYQPLSRILHFEGITHGRDESSGVKAYQVTNLKKFHSKWRYKYEEFKIGRRDIHDEANRLFDKKMLVVDALTHAPDRDAGSLVASEMMRSFRVMGFHQYFVALSNYAVNRPYTEDYQRNGVEVLHAPFVSSVTDIVKWSEAYDYALIFRFGICRYIIDTLRAANPTCRVIFSNVDLHYLRMNREAELKQSASLAIAASYTQTLELEVMTKVDCNLVHTREEKEIIRAEMPYIRDNIVEFPWVKEANVSSVPLDNRKDVMFLGGFSHRPNVDAVIFFVNEVWPNLSKRLNNESKFIVVGSSPPEHILDLASDRIEVTGHVAELPPYFNRARVFVAPLRFGAGIKGKLIESMANGVPSVATNIAAEGIGIIDGIHFLQANNAEEFVSAIVKLYEDEELGIVIQKAGYQFVEQNFSRNKAGQILSEALSVADSIWLCRQEAIRSRKLRASAKKYGLTLPQKL